MHTYIHCEKERERKKESTYIQNKRDLFCSKIILRIIIYNNLITIIIMSFLLSKRVCVILSMKKNVYENKNVCYFL